jgi:hypothetical protein
MEWPSSASPDRRAAHPANHSDHCNGAPTTDDAPIAYRSRDVDASAAPDARAADDSTDVDHFTGPDGLAASDLASHGDNPTLPAMAAELAHAINSAHCVNTDLSVADERPNAGLDTTRSAIQLDTARTAAKLDAARTTVRLDAARAAAKLDAARATSQFDATRSATQSDARSTALNAHVVTITA